MQNLFRLKKFIKGRKVLVNDFFVIILSVDLLNLMLKKGQEWITNMERSTGDQIEDEQDYDETEDDSYMGDAASDVEPQSPPW